MKPVKERVKNDIKKIIGENLKEALQLKERVEGQYIWYDLNLSIIDPIDSGTVRSLDITDMWLQIMADIKA